MRFNRPTPQSPLPAAAHHRLQQLQAQPELAGERVYCGTVYPLRGAPAERAGALFTYARHVRPTAQGLEASHLTYDLQGRLIIEERVALTQSHALHRMDVANRQTGHAGSVVADADAQSLHFTWSTGHTTRTAREPLAPKTLLVAGPNLHSTLLRHWDLLHAGLALRVHMLVPARLGSYGFTVRCAGAAPRCPRPPGDEPANPPAAVAPAIPGPDTTTFVATPSNLLLRWALAPLRSVFDSEHRSLTRYEGRVPPHRQTAEGRLRDLDARVLYTPQAQGYR